MKESKNRVFRFSVEKNAMVGIFRVPLTLSRCQFFQQSGQLPRLQEDRIALQAPARVDLVQPLELSDKVMAGQLAAG